MATLGTVWNNGRVSLTMDLVFGLCVLTAKDDGTDWLIVEGLEKADFYIVYRAVDGNTSCPWLKELDLIRGKMDSGVLIANPHKQA